MNHSHTIRVLQDPPLDGPTNMAHDEVLMTRVGAGESPPTLRLYQWSPPTISLGYFQPFAEYEALPAPAGSLPVVRRLTGGGAILHDLELTYSLTIPVDHPLMSAGPNRLYEIAHDGIIASLEGMGIPARRGGDTDDSTPTRGPFFCFARRHGLDVLAADGKVAGSAQRRTHLAVLQHGSIILGNRFTQQPTGTLRCGGAEPTNTMRSAFVVAMARISGEAFEPDDWSTAELAGAAALKPKYAADDWTKRA